MKTAKVRSFTGVLALILPTLATADAARDAYVKQCAKCHGMGQRDSQRPRQSFADYGFKWIHYG